MAEKNKGGRPKITVDMEAVDNLAGIFCTADEIIAFLRISHDTLARRVKSQNGISLADYLKQKRDGIAKPSLRRMQYLTAKGGSCTMQIWLGKQYLGQRDTPLEDADSGKIPPVKVIIEAYDARKPRDQDESKPAAE